MLHFVPARTAPPKLAQARKSLAVGPDGLRVVVVADTHSAPHPRAAELIAAQRPDHILHAGDIGDLEVIEALAELAPTHAIRGNIDVRAAELPDALTLDLTSDERVLLRVLMLHIAVAGPRLRGDAARLARAEGASLVICGHSHVPFIGRDAGLTVFNPGSIGPRRFHLPIIFGVLVVAPGRIELFHVDCETGRRWLP